MTDNDRNIRTLVLCFILGVLALVPLRFVESKNAIMNVSQSQVLGEVVQQEEVVLPNGELGAEVLNARLVPR